MTALSGKGRLKQQLAFQCYRHTNKVLFSDEVEHILQIQRAVEENLNYLLLTQGKVCTGSYCRQADAMYIHSFTCSKILPMSLL